MESSRPTKTDGATLVVDPAANPAPAPGDFHRDFQMTEHDLGTPPGRTYDVILCDPPWKYQHSVLMDAPPYPTMTPEELAKLPVADVAAKNSLLFMWATGPKMQEALELMARWGFEYVTVAYVWVKVGADGMPSRKGMGYYTRSATEFILLGRRGRGHTKRMSCRNQCQTMLHRVLQHSRKPAVFAKQIKTLFKGARRLELFARCGVPGWDCIGNQLESPESASPTAATSTDFFSRAPTQRAGE
jgi:N6-adenosine-specific RNA methylase IME4